MAKTNAVERLKNKEFTGCLNLCEGDTRKKQAKDGEILCLLQSIFSKQKQDRAIPFPIIFLLRF